MHCFTLTEDSRGQQISGTMLEHQCRGGNKAMNLTRQQTTPDSWSISIQAKFTQVYITCTFHGIIFFLPKRSMTVLTKQFLEINTNSVRVNFKFTNGALEFLLSFHHG